MGLYMALDITAGGLTTMRIGGLEIVRTEERKESLNPENEVHRYRATMWKSGEVIRGPVFFEHRYGDDAWVCVRKALEALET